MSGHGLQALPLPTLHPVQSALKLAQYLMRRGYEYLLYTVVSPRRFALLNFDNQWSPVRARLREFLSDLYTCAYRMEKRIQALPYSYNGMDLPVWEYDPEGRLVLCKHMRDYIRDTERFVYLHPEATLFDMDWHFLGRLEAEKCALNTAVCSKGDSGENASEELTPACGR